MSSLPRRTGTARIQLSCFSSPVGVISVVEGLDGVALIQFGTLSFEACSARFSRAWGVPVAVEDVAASMATAQLKEYFEGRRREFALALDRSLTGGFYGRALSWLQRRIGFGQRTSYGELAASIGNPGGARAVGGAMRTNPHPIVVPCHRVLAASGKLGGFAGGLPVKRWLLAHEERTTALPPNHRATHSPGAARAR